MLCSQLYKKKSKKFATHINFYLLTFSGSSKAILKIPKHIITPYNAQATMHFYDAFWALYLPVTVAGRVSDIWRSYFSQSLFSSLGLSIGFLPRLLIWLPLHSTQSGLWTLNEIEKTLNRIKPSQGEGIRKISYLKS